MLAVQSVISFAVWSALVTTVAAQTYKEHMEAVLKTTYDSNERPHYATKRPVVITEHIDVMDMGVSKSTFHLELYLRQTWHDPRIRFNSSIGVVNVPRHISHIWVPDTVFRNAKEATSHHVTVPNMYLRAQPNGTLVYSQKYSVYLHCIMDLAKFPLDTQVCALELSLYGSGSDEVRLNWSRGSVGSNRRGCATGSVLVDTDNMEASEYVVQRVTCGRCSDSSAVAKHTIDCLSAAFELKRMRGNYIINAYVPYTLIVAMSYSSFWIDLKCTPARVSVAFITLLSIYTKNVGLHSTLVPSVSYVVALDVYMFVCLCFVMFALLEYIVAAHLDAESSREGQPGEWTNGKALDKLFRWLFPLAFIAVVIVYWISYIYII